MIKYGDNIQSPSVYVGTIPFIKVCRQCLAAIQVVKWWQGTDVLECLMFPPGKSKVKVVFHRIKMWLLAFIIYDHWFVSERLRQALPRAYRRKDGEVKPVYGQKLKVEKVPHERFNVLVYVPNHRKKYNDWVYGLDIIDRLRDRYGNKIHWLIADGTLDMKQVYPVTDMMIRPSRWDGAPKMVMECEEFGIPYYWSEDGKPDFEAICEKVDNIASKYSS